MDKSIYEVIVKNEYGSQKTAISSTNRSLKLSSYQEKDGFHAGELIAHAWATCLHETVKVILKAKRMSYESICYVKACYVHEKKPKIGYKFLLNAYLEIINLSEAQTEMILKKAHQLCPISKLLHHNEDVNLHVISKKEDWMNL
jgi:lipoyl-dependent peroxiredoxin